ncbi:hypothetical protein Tco_0770716 [Tanacetum coccineum]|uniref:Reverse transcriptase Ty1/copia-type domain-containing protein n=1 Tax=Tanacetum coccineum TaxID=301880 RepID=A0ABQ4ZD96_9ASTR
MDKSRFCSRNEKGICRQRNRKDVGDAIKSDLVEIRIKEDAEEDSKALVTIDGKGVDWTSHSEEDEDYALMACNSSGSDTEEFWSKGDKANLETMCKVVLFGKKRIILTAVKPSAGWKEDHKDTLATMSPNTNGGSRYPHRDCQNKRKLLIVDVPGHMTGNKPTLLDIKTLMVAMFFVAFGGSNGYITVNVADFTNLETVVNVSPIPTSRINSFHPSALILGDPNSAVQTRSKVTKSSGAYAFVSYVQKKRRNNHKDFQHCLFACFLSQNEPKKISEALEDESWVECICKKEFEQFKIQKVWILVDLPYGKKAIGTKWVYRNKKDERGVVVRNKARFSDPKSSSEASAKWLKLCMGYIKTPRAWCYLTASRPDYQVCSSVLVLGFRKSTKGGCQFLGRETHFLGNGKKRPLWLLSTTKAEFVAAASCCGQFLESLRRVFDGTEALMLSTLFILWLATVSTDSAELVPMGKTDPSPRPAPSTTIPDSIPESSGGNHGGHSSSDKSLLGNEGEMTLQSVYDLCISLCTQGRKSAKGEPSVHKDKLFDEIPTDSLDYMETEDSQDVGKTRDVVDEEKENAKDVLSTEDVLISTDGSKVSTDKEKDSTGRTDEGTDGQTEGGRATQATQTTRIPTSTIFGDDETIAQVLLNMSQAKAVLREKEKGVEFKDVEETERPTPTSTRSLLTLKPLPKIDPKDKGKNKIEEEDESKSESDGIPEAEKKFKQLASDEEMARKVHFLFTASCLKLLFSFKNTTDSLSEHLSSSVYFPFCLLDQSLEDCLDRGFNVKCDLVDVGLGLTSS